MRSRYASAYHVVCVISRFIRDTHLPNYNRNRDKIFSAPNPVLFLYRKYLPTEPFFVVCIVLWIRKVEKRKDCDAFREIGTNLMPFSRLFSISKNMWIKFIPKLTAWDNFWCFVQNECESEGEHIFGDFFPGVFSPLLFAHFEPHSFPFISGRTM